jgi:hypothetical protein
MSSVYWIPVLSAAAALLLVPDAVAQNVTSQSGDTTASSVISGYTPFVEITYGSFDIGGEFNDSLILSTQGEVINVPEVQRACGFGIAAGWLAEAGRGGFSAFYFRANPPTTSVIQDHDSHFKIWGLDLFAAIRPQGTEVIAPMVSFGFSFPSLKIDESATDGVSVEDANYDGYAYSVGGGAHLHIGRLGHITLEYRHRWMRFTGVEATQDRIKIDGNLNATAGFLKIGASVYLGR